MRYFIPDIHLRRRTDQGQLEKLGGLPWGLPTSKWPKCARCGRSQSFLAQFNHDAERLDLGQLGRVLFAFHCVRDAMGSSWKDPAGSNSCFVIEPDELTSTASMPPPDAPPTDNQVWITEWFERDDGIPPSLADRFLADDLGDLEEGLFDGPADVTRLGSVPSWIQSPTEAPKGADWQFVGQLDSTYSFYGDPKADDYGWVAADKKQQWQRKHVGAGPDFGDGGMAYLFLRRVGQVPDGYVFWQCY